jgi:hypothetical protein
MEETKHLGRDHVIIPLLGRFKGEQNTCYHLAPLAAETRSGLKVQHWVERLIAVHENGGRVCGPAFCGPAGEVASSFSYDVGFVERLLIVQPARPDVIPVDVDISKQFGGRVPKSIPWRMPWVEYHDTNPSAGETIN